MGGRLQRMAPDARRWVVALVVVLLATTATYVGQGLLVAAALARVFALSRSVPRTGSSCWTAAASPSPEPTGT